MERQIAKETYQFDKIRALGLAPGVTNLAEYRLRMEHNIPRSHEWLITQHPLLDLTISKILEAHRLTFHDIHPAWAGTLRGQDTQVLRVGRFVAADWQRVVPELEGALAQQAILLSRSLLEPHGGRDIAPQAAIAFFHVRFERIHPFRDGNGRTGRIIMSAQAKELTGNLISFDDRDGYVAALHAADQGFLTPLVNIVLRETRQPPTTVAIPCPFRVGPYFLGDPERPDSLQALLESSRLYASRYEKAFP